MHHYSQCLAFTRTVFATIFSMSIAIVPYTSTRSKVRRDTPPSGYGSSPPGNSGGTLGDTAAKKSVLTLRLTTLFVCYVFMSVGVCVWNVCPDMTRNWSPPPAKSGGTSPRLRKDGIIVINTQWRMKLGDRITQLVSGRCTHQT